MLNTKGSASNLQMYLNRNQKLKSAFTSFFFSCSLYSTISLIIKYSIFLRPNKSHSWRSKASSGFSPWWWKLPSELDCLRWHCLDHKGPCLKICCAAPSFGGCPGSSAVLEQQRESSCQQRQQNKRGLESFPQTPLLYRRHNDFSVQGGATTGVLTQGDKEPS